MTHKRYVLTNDVDSSIRMTTLIEGSIEDVIIKLNKNLDGLPPITGFREISEQDHTNAQGLRALRNAWHDGDPGGQIDVDLAKVRKVCKKGIMTRVSYLKDIIEKEIGFLDVTDDAREIADMKADLKKINDVKGEFLKEGKRLDNVKKANEVYKKPLVIFEQMIKKYIEER